MGVIVLYMKQYEDVDRATDLWRWYSELNNGTDTWLPVTS
jgi:hypothetical protein